MKTRKNHCKRCIKHCALTMLCMCLCLFCACGIIRRDGSDGGHGKSVTDVKSLDNQARISADEILDGAEYEAKRYVNLCEYKEIEVQMNEESYECSREDIEACAKAKLAGYRLKSGKSPNYESLSDEEVYECMYGENGCATVEEYLEYIESELMEAEEAQYSEDLKKKVLEYLSENSSVTLPKGSEKKRAEKYLYALDDSGDKSEYMKENKYENEDELMSALLSYAAEEIKKELILSAIIEDLSYSVSESGFEKYIAQYADTAGVEREEIFRYYGGESVFLWYYAQNQLLKDLCNDVSVIDIGMSIEK